MGKLVLKNISEHHKLILSLETQKISLWCPICKSEFIADRRLLLGGFFNKKTRVKYCSKTCSNKAQSRGASIVVFCDQCSKQFIKMRSQIKKTSHSFCSKRCAGIYNSQHKTYGFRRSKVEIYLEEQLHKFHPDLIVLTNDRTFGYELDFYFPELKFAIELNGIVHYEPIYGDSQFQRIKNADQQKMSLCKEAGVELCVIDISFVKYWNQSKLDYYLQIVLKLIDRIKGRKILADR